MCVFVFWGVGWGRGGGEGISAGNIIYNSLEKIFPPGAKTYTLYGAIALRDECK